MVIRYASLNMSLNTGQWVHGCLCGHLSHICHILARPILRHRRFALLAAPSRSGDNKPSPIMIAPVIIDASIGYPTYHMDAPEITAAVHAIIE